MLKLKRRGSVGCHFPPLSAYVETSNESNPLIAVDDIREHSLHITKLQGVETEEQTHSRQKSQSERKSTERQGDEVCDRASGGDGGQVVFIESCCTGVKTCFCTSMKENTQERTYVCQNVICSIPAFWQVKPFKGFFIYTWPSHVKPVAYSAFTCQTCSIFYCQPSIHSAFVALWETKCVSPCASSQLSASKPSDLRYLTGK